MAFCEREPFPQQVLRKHWPNVPIYDDVCTLTADRLREDEVLGDDRAIDIISAGYPCQPFSHAGKRRGEEDDRHLWPEVARLLSEIRPRWFLGENVAGHITLGLDIVLSDLEGIGYTTQTFVIPSAAVNAPHRRDRVFIVGHTERSRCSGQSRGRTEQVTSDGHRQLEEGALAYTKGESSRRLSIGAAAENTRFARRSENVAYAEKQGFQECQGSRGRNEGLSRLERNSVCRGRKTERGTAQSRVGGMLDGLSRKLDEHRWPAALGQDQYDWEPPRVATGIKNRVGRLKALGNAVNPHQVYLVLAAIKAINDSL
ncbi:DNA cytosine methyltransferase [Paenibacillus sp. FSL P2-0173]|uniref:DNA cytosine methyltransferase n=1 Tax=Paenibacillus sp. FSL P2-0173 TaxID=2921627 RepID=UPI0030FCD752